MHNFDINSIRAQLSFYIFKINFSYVIIEKLNNVVFPLPHFTFYLTIYPLLLYNILSCLCVLVLTSSLTLLCVLKLSCLAFLIFESITLCDKN